MDDQHATLSMPILLDLDSLMKPFKQASLSPSRFEKGCRANHLSRAPVCHAKQYFAAALVGERDTISDQLVKLVSTFGGFKFETSAFHRVEVGLKLFCCCHEGL